MSEVKKDMIKFVKELYDRSILDTAGGNISVREGDKILVTPRKSSSDRHWDLDEECIIETDLKGKALNQKLQGSITRESRVHYRVYNELPDIGAILHVHPRYLMAFATLKMDVPIVTSIAWDWGFPQYVKCIKGEPAVTVSEARAITKYFKYLINKNSNAALGCLLPGHGAVVAGKDLRDTFSKLHSLENNARTFINMQVIKSSEDYNEMKRRESESMFDSWVDILETPIEEVELFFERDEVEF
jgi:L-fuculose-phosphate aldolase